MYGGFQRCEDSGVVKEFSSMVSLQWDPMGDFFSIVGACLRAGCIRCAKFPLGGAVFFFRCEFAYMGGAC